MPVEVGCGQCIGCRLERSRQWAVRCMHEAQMHEDNCFITLTFDNEHIPQNGSLDVSIFQRFMKRLRKEYAPKKIRFFHCGEYGEKFKRPHYHACLFGFDFSDLVSYNTGKGVVQSSNALKKLWPYGFNTVGELTFDSAAYVARYITKKVTGQAALLHYTDIDFKTGEVLNERKPEYTTMSRRPGIGKKWFDEFKDEVYPSDSVVVRGKEMKPPKYYDSQYEIIEPEKFLKIKDERVKEASKHLNDQTEERLKVRQKVAEAKLNLKKRSFENE